MSARIDPDLTRTGDGKLGKPVREGDAVLRVGSIRLAGDPARLTLLEEVLGGRAPSDLDAVFLPRDLEQFERLVVERERLVGDLLVEGRRLVEEVERLVLALYDVPDELTDEVVAHAIRRAESAT